MSDDKHHDRTVMRLVGRAGGDAREFTANNGNRGASVSVCMDTGPGMGQDGPPTWVNVVGWDEKAHAVAQIKKGNAVRVMGPVKAKRWADKAGEVQQRLEVIVDQLRIEQ